MFPDAELAKGRAEYLQRVLKNSGLGAEYDYLDGPVLVRVEVTSAQAKPRLRDGTPLTTRPAAPPWDILRGMITA